MGTLHVGGETLTDAVARRLRGQLAELRINQKHFSELTGWGRATVYRRLAGETALNTSELEHIEETTGITVTYLLTGTPPTNRPPSTPTAAHFRGGKPDHVDQPTGVQPALTLCAAA